MKLSLRWKYLLFILLSTLFGLVGIGSLYFVNRISSQKLIDISAKNLSAIYKTSELKSLFADQVAIWHGELLSGKEATAALDEASKKTLDAAVRLKDSVDEDLKPMADEFITLQDDLSKKRALARANHLSAGSRDAVAAYQASEEVEKKALQSLGNLGDMVLLGTQGQQESVITDSNRLTSLFLGAFLLIGAVIAVLCFIFASRVSKQLDKYSTSLFSLSRIFSSRAESILASSSTVANKVETQTSAVHETSVAMDEIGSMLARSSENASRASDSAEKSKHTLEQGQTAVQNLMESMHKISDSNGALVHQMDKSLREFSDVVRIISEIGDKTKVINEIVFQTKLLSFNASVEAARAGEAGKGFAVVAEEVGNLATMSGTAAREITEMLETSIHKVKLMQEESQTGISSVMSTNKAAIASGQQDAQGCRDALVSIQSDAGEMQTFLRDIAITAREQEKAVDEVRRAITGLSQASQESADATQETTALAQDIAVQSKNIRDMASELTSFVSAKSLEQVERESEDAANSAVDEAEENDSAA